MAEKQKDASPAPADQEEAVVVESAPADATEESSPQEEVTQTPQEAIEAARAVFKVD